MILRPITLREANAFVARHHRHNKPARGCRFCLAAVDEDDVVGVAIVGRPVARRLDDGLTAEVLRLCVAEDAPRNSCSFLYGAAKRAWRAMGGLRLVTYTLATESGASLRGAGWTPERQVPAGEWSRATRLRQTQPVYSIDKVRWLA